ncbi:MAG: TIGR00269 family protein [Candidatus Thorarchaeota archaeon]|nr:TIGR00269 family protein [Candidatus Thorarchaeota archaeon]
MSVICSKCGQDAVYLRRYTSERLCKACLVQTTVDRVRKTINRNKMLEANDRIVVAISGGKDSAVLLDVMHRIERNYPGSELVPLTIDEGIKGYRDEALSAARKLAETLGLKLEVRSFHDMFDMALDDIVNTRDESKPLGACSYCGVLRRRAINTAALELRADVVATGHNMDDEAQTVMMNIMRGDGRRIGRTNKPRSSAIQGFIPRIKPIIELSERDVVAYAHHLNLPYHDIPCPYAVEACRNDIRLFLNEMEHKRPGTLTAILRSGESISDALLQEPKKYVTSTCLQCGSPTAADTCKACKLLDEISSRELSDKNGPKTRGST